MEFARDRFNGKAYEEIADTERYIWMNELGNQAVADGTGGIKIADPKAAAKLLDLVIESARNTIGKPAVVFEHRSAGIHHMKYRDAPGIRTAVTCRRRGPLPHPARPAVISFRRTSTDRADPHSARIL